MKDVFEIGDRALFCAHYAANVRDAFGQTKIGTVVEVEPHADGIMDGPSSVLFKTIAADESESLERARQGFRSKNVLEPLDWLEIDDKLVGMVELRKFVRRPLDESYLPGDFDFSKILGRRVSLIIADHGNICLLENTQLLPGEEYAGTVIAEEGDFNLTSGVGKLAFHGDTWDRIAAVEWDGETYVIQDWHFPEPVLVKETK